MIVSTPHFCAPARNYNMRPLPFGSLFLSRPWDFADWVSLGNVHYSHFLFLALYLHWILRPRPIPTIFRYDFSDLFEGIRGKLTYHCNPEIAITNPSIGSNALYEFEYIFLKNCILWYDSQKLTLTKFQRFRVVELQTLKEVILSNRSISYCFRQIVERLRVENGTESKAHLTTQLVSDDDEYTRSASVDALERRWRWRWDSWATGTFAPVDADRSSSQYSRSQNAWFVARQKSTGISR